jgi:hypothetical protein
MKERKEMNTPTRVTIDADTYYTIRSFLMTAEGAVSEQRRIYVWQPDEITKMIESLNNDASFSFAEVEV